jgi:hypothetical protein
VEIFANDRIEIPLSNITFIEKQANGTIWVITKDTRYNFEKDMWDNFLCIYDGEARFFLKEWHDYINKKSGTKLNG